MAAIKTAIELTEHEARVLQVRAGKQPRVKAAVRIALPGSAGAEPQSRARARGEALRDGLKAAGLRVGSAVVVIPKRSATIRYAILPSTDENELEKMARFEAERHIPFNAQRHVISHCVMRKQDLEGSHVLLAAIDAPDLDEIVEMASVAGFDIDAIDVSSVAQFNILKNQAPAAQREQTVGYLHVGLASTDISIVSKGLMLFTRSAPNGIERLLADLREALPQAASLSPEDLRGIDLLNPADDLRRLGLAAQPEASAEVPEGLESAPTRAPAAQDAETILREWLNRLSVEIQRSYEFAHRELDCPPIASVVVSGEAAAWRHFAEYIRAAFGVETTAAGALNGLGTESARIENPQAFTAAAGALGRYWRSASTGVNLIPPSYRAKGARRRRRQSLVLTSVLVLLAIALGYVWLRMAGELREDTIAELRKANEELEPLAADLSDREKQLEIINEFRDDKRSALAVLDFLNSLTYIPDRLTLSVFDFHKDEYVVLNGYALDIQDMTRLIIDMREATSGGEKIFRGSVTDTKKEFNVRLPERDANLVKFSIEGRFNADDD